MINRGISTVWRAVLAALPMLPQAVMAQPAAHPFEGTWIRDPALSKPPPNLPATVPHVSETVSIAHDDGRRYASRINQTFGNGGKNIFVADTAEDGSMHPIDPTDKSLLFGISVLPDGARKLVSTDDGARMESTCRVSADAATMWCEGVYYARSGSAGPYSDVYHRASRAMPVS